MKQVLLVCSIIRLLPIYVLPKFFGFILRKKILLLYILLVNTKIVIVYKYYIFIYILR